MIFIYVVVILSTHAWALICGVVWQEIGKEILCLR